MTSIMTNQSAMTALQSLTNTNKNLSQTQTRISTGYRVSSAEDNAAYWSIATTMKRWANQPSSRAWLPCRWPPENPCATTTATSPLPRIVA